MLASPLRACIPESPETLLVVEDIQGLLLRFCVESSRDHTVDVEEQEMLVARAMVWSGRVRQLWRRNSLLR